MVELDVDAVYNADQTPIFFEHLPAKTIDDKGVNTVWIRTAGMSKDRMSCMLLGESHGTKFETFLVIKWGAATKPTVSKRTSQRDTFLGVACGPP